MGEELINGPEALKAGARHAMRRAVHLVAASQRPSGAMETNGSGHEHRDVRFEPELVVRTSSGSGPR